VAHGNMGRPLGDTRRGHALRAERCTVHVARPPARPRALAPAALRGYAIQPGGAASFLDHRGTWNP
jgi:hypothetical protein